MNKKNLAHFFLLFIFVFMVAVPALAQGQQHSLQGKVQFPDGSAPPNSVKVTITFNGRRVYEIFRRIRRDQIRQDAEGYGLEQRDHGKREIACVGEKISRQSAGKQKVQIR